MGKLVATFCLLLIGADTVGYAQEDKGRTTDEVFLKKAAMGGFREVKLSERAVESATNPKVKEFAQKMVKDHTRMNDMLLERARDLKVAIVVGIEKETREKLDVLSRQKGEDFDRTYIAQMVEDHEAAVRLFESQAKNGQNANLKNLANENLTTIRAHLKHAQELADQLKK